MGVNLHYSPVESPFAYTIYNTYFDHSESGLCLNRGLTLWQLSGDDHWEATKRGHIFGAKAAKVVSTRLGWTMLGDDDSFLHMI